MTKYKAEITSENPKEIEAVLDAAKHVINCNPQIESLSVHVSAEETKPAAEEADQDIFPVANGWGVC